MSKKIILPIILVASAMSLRAQVGYITIKASDKYNRSGFSKFFLGEHYRKIWHTPVKVPLVMLDTLKGGLTPYALGGSRQTKSIRLRDKQKREWVMRSVDKSFGGAIPDEFQGTFVEDLANDQVTFSHPYGSLIAAYLAENVGVYHTNPQLVYLPKQAALGKYNDEAGDVLYMLEMRPDEDWSDAKNFANSSKIISTDKFLEKLNEDNKNVVDEKQFVRSRLFDFFINDWGRHEDQWRWAKKEEGKKNIYEPIPRDRDNAFTKFDGLLVRAGTPRHLQSFKNNLKRVNYFGFTARGLDRRLTPSLSLQDWEAIAKEMQEQLTDEVIANAVKQVPQEVYELTVKEGFVTKLMSRRQHLVEWATTYFKFINAGGVDVVGTEDREKFVINRINDNETAVTVYKSKGGDTKGDALYKRTFLSNETKEIRLFGLGGDDVYEVCGNTHKGPKLVIVGTKADETLVNSITGSGHGQNITFHDDTTHHILENKGNIDFKIRDTVKYIYPYKYFKYNVSRTSPIAFYNREDRIHVGLQHTWIRNKWSKEPYWYKHRLAAKYSIDQKGYSVGYQGSFNKLIGNWNLNMAAVYDQVRWLNFYGLGNESVLSTLDRDYFRFRHRELFAQIGIEQVIQNRQRITIAPFYQLYIPIVDTERYVSKTNAYNQSSQLSKKSFAGVGVEYVYQRLNDSILPRKGLGIQLFGSYTQPLTDKSKSGFVRLGADFHAYIPLGKTFHIAIKGGGATLTGGTPEFYQYNTTGGTRTIRGHQRERFHGTTTIYNQNELHFVKSIHSYLYNGKLSLFALYDIGRVYEKNESSNTWHYGYGGGIIITPFNKISLIAAYAMSREDKNLHLRILRVL